MTKKLRVYIAGPMTGYDLWNFPAFDAAAANLTLAGYDPVSPADLDRDLGFSPTSLMVSPEFLRDALKRDLAAICDCDGIALLPGWSDSAGARIELALALRLGLFVLDARSLEPITAPDDPTRVTVIPAGACLPPTTVACHKGAACSRKCADQGNNASRASG